MRQCVDVVGEILNIKHSTGHLTPAILLSRGLGGQAGGGAKRQWQSCQTANFTRDFEGPLCL